MSYSHSSTSSLPVSSISKYSQHMRALSRAKSAELRRRLREGDTVRLVPCPIDQADGVLVCPISSSPPPSSSSPSSSSSSSLPQFYSPPSRSSSLSSLPSSPTPTPTLSDTSLPHGKGVSYFLTGPTLESLRSTRDIIGLPHVRLLGYRVVRRSSSATPTVTPSPADPGRHMGSDCTRSRSRSVTMAAAFQAKIEEMGVKMEELEVKIEQM
jgi:hypothetical protein